MFKLLFSNTVPLITDFRSLNLLEEIMKCNLPLAMKDKISILKNLITV